MNAALLTLRLVMGLAMAAHGSQKLFGWFGGGGIRGTGVYLDSLGYRPGCRFALLAGLAEFLGGVLLALGLLNPVGPALMLSDMLVAILTVHKSHGFFALNNGAELPVLYITGALTVAFAGAGQYSLDHVLRLDSDVSPIITWAALLLGVLGALSNVAMRHSSELPAKTTSKGFITRNRVGSSKGNRHAERNQP